MHVQVGDQVLSPSPCQILVCTATEPEDSKADEETVPAENLGKVKTNQPNNSIGDYYTNV